MKRVLFVISWENLEPFYCLTSTWFPVIDTCTLVLVLQVKSLENVIKIRTVKHFVNFYQKISCLKKKSLIDMVPRKDPFYGLVYVYSWSVPCSMVWVTLLYCTKQFDFLVSPWFHHEVYKY